MSDIELCTWERGRVWRVREMFTAANRRRKKLTIRKGFKHDRYTLAPDLPDEKPAVVHDYCYEANPAQGSGRKWDDGSSISREEADEFLHDLMATSDDETTRQAADTYYKGVRLLGGPVWIRGTIKMWLRNITKGRGTMKKNGMTKLGFLTALVMILVVVVELMPVATMAAYPSWDWNSNDLSGTNGVQARVDSLHTRMVRIGMTADNTTNAVFCGVTTSNLAVVGIIPFSGIVTNAGSGNTNRVYYYKGFVTNVVVAS